MAQYTFYFEKQRESLLLLDAGLSGPSSIMIALFFIGWTQTPLAASQATVVVPPIMGIDGLFILTYAFIVRQSFPLALLASLLVWVYLVFLLVKKMA